MTPTQGEPRHGGAFPSTLDRMPRNHVITIRVSEETAQAIDRLRGAASRARWVGELVAAELNSVNPAVAPVASTSTCDHPRARVIKGFCYKCGSMVLK